MWRSVNIPARAGDYLTGIIGIVYVTAFTIAVLFIVARLFGTEKILTASLRFRRFRLSKTK